MQSKVRSAGCDLQTSRAAQQLASEHEGLYFTAGVHPHNAKVCNEDTIGALRELAADERCVAIGECGLDFCRNFSSPDVQEEWFHRQVLLFPIAGLVTGEHTLSWSSEVLRTQALLHNLVACAGRTCL